MPTSSPDRSGSKEPSIFPIVLVTVLLLVLNISHLLRAQQARPSREAGKGKSNENLVERGKYLVEGVAFCGQCHTPRDSAGNLDRSRWLEGGALWLQPAQPMADWPLKAPRIAGSPPGSDEELITLLTTGIWRDGKPLRPPMPQFRMSREDATAVVAYLRSLTQSAP
jgi:mono/diheme cytochrome c family protein